jgi:Spy/CpxP family protein refolding chaperone
MRGGNVVQAALSVSNLTDEQKAKLEKIQAGLQEKMKEAMAGAGDAATSGPAGRGAFANPEFRKVLTDARAEVESILTDEQKKELQEKMPPRRARGEAGQTSGPGEGRRGGRTQ